MEIVTATFFHNVSGFLPLCRLVLKQLFVDIDDEALRSGLLIRPGVYNLQGEGKTILVHRDQLGLMFGATRMGYAVFFGWSSIPRSCVIHCSDSRGYCEDLYETGARMLQSYKDL
jgi:hypothetical protein